MKCFVWRKVGLAKVRRSPLLCHGRWRSRPIDEPRTPKFEPRREFQGQRPQRKQRRRRFGLCRSLFFWTFDCSLWISPAPVLLSTLRSPRPANRPSPNRVLELDGTNSFVELPADAFTHLHEVTVEGWVKWESFGPMSRFFDFTLGGYELNIQNRDAGPALHIESIRGDRPRQRHRAGISFPGKMDSPGSDRFHQWVQLVRQRHFRANECQLRAVPRDRPGEAKLSGAIQFQTGLSNGRGLSAGKWTKSAFGAAHERKRKSGRPCSSS